MSKSSRQHWQEDSNDYTFNQYAFYLVVLGLVMAALLVWLIPYIFPPAPPVTHLVAIYSEPGGELPVIPFQESDSDALQVTFPDSFKPYSFNDKTSFEQEVIDELVKDYANNQDIDTMMIWLSAIGKVENGQPVILGSDPNAKIEFDFLIQQLGRMNAESIILLLDCNHAFADQDAYRDDSQLETDFNQFGDAVVESLQAETGKIQVLVYGMPGQQPLYSTMRRRSLFGYALENTFIQNAEQIEWEAEAFLEELDSLCFSYGGAAAPELKWLGTEMESIKFRRPVSPLIKELADVAAKEKEEETNEKKDEEEGTDPDIVEMVAGKRTINKELNAAWEEMQKILNSSRIDVPPGALDPKNWDTLSQQIVSFAVDELQSSIPVNDIEARCDNARLQIGDFGKDLMDGSQRISKRLNLIPPDPAEDSESDDDRQKRAVSKDYFQVHDLRWRLPHYIAAADSLSWIFPNHQFVKPYREQTNQLIKLFDHANSSDVFEQNPSLEKNDAIERMARKLLGQEEQILKSLSELCRNVIQRSNGFQREMAVEVVLRLPFLEIEKPAADDPRMKEPYRLYSRQELQELLLNNPLNTDDRVETSSRVAASINRREMYKLFRDHIGPAEETEQSPYLSRRLQTYAYRLPTGAFDFQIFLVADRKVRQNVQVRNRNKLENSQHYIELGPSGTTLDLDLSVKIPNQGVEVRCEIIPNETAAQYFEFADSSGPTKTYSEQQNPVLIAKQEAAGDDPECLLLVTVVDNNKQTWDRLEIPIRLPTNNSIDLITDFGESKTEFKQGAVGQRIRPFANHDLTCNFSLRNNWHKKRSGTISLFACADPEVDTIVGKINQNVIKQTQQRLAQGTLSKIASFKFKLPKATVDQPYDPVTVKWGPPSPDWEPDGPAIFANQGFVCVIEHDEPELDDWFYWIPIFPIENPPVLIDPGISSDDLVINVDRRSLVPADMAIEIEWRFSDEKFPTGKKTLKPGQQNLTTDVLISNVSEQLTAGTFLYFDIDDWPRKFVYRFDGARFRISTIKDAIVNVRLGQPEDTPPKEPELIPLKTSPEFHKVFGTKSDRRTVTATIEPNVPTSGEEFRFETAQDYIQLVEEDDSTKLYYPRKIENQIRLAPKPGTISINPLVSDHQLTFEDVGNLFNISPVLNLAGSDHSLEGSNRIRIQFDKKPPVIYPNDGVFVLRSSVETGKPLRINVNTHDDNGVGVDPNGIEIFLSEPNRRLSSLDGKPMRAKKIMEGVYEIIAPKDLGTYTVGVRVFDLVKNKSEELSSNGVVFKVVKPKPAPVRKPVVPKVFTHDLTVTVIEKFGAAITKPEITIDPENAKPESIGNNTFVFKGLSGGVRYTISANCKISSGPAKGDELSGSAQHRFPEANESKKGAITLTVKL